MLNKIILTILTQFPKILKDKKLLLKLNKSSILLLLFIFLCVFFIGSSCAPELVFGDLVICEEIDNETSAPLQVKDEFKIDAEKIFATIEVVGARADDTWRFTWINIETNQVLADATNIYSSGNTSYIQGYLSSHIIPGGSGPIIGEPGKYRVDFYHNNVLESSAEFIIQIPKTNIIEVVLTGEVDENSEPLGSVDKFYPDDTIYTAVKLNYRLKGDELSVKWYNEDEVLLGQIQYVLEEDSLAPGYIVFEVVNANEIPWPHDKYKIEVYHKDTLFEIQYYEIIPEPVPAHNFQEENIYENQDYKFSINFPDGWGSGEIDDETGLKVNFTPSAEEMNVAMNLLVLKEGYYPSGEEYTDFADDIISGIITSTDTEEMEKTESDENLGDISYKKIEFLNVEDEENGLNITLAFIEHDKKLYLFIKVTDLHYLEFAEKVYQDMLESLSFD